MPQRQQKAMRSGHRLLSTTTTTSYKVKEAEESLPIDHTSLAHQTAKNHHIQETLQNLHPKAAVDADVRLLPSLLPSTHHKTPNPSQRLFLLVPDDLLTNARPFLPTCNISGGYL